jgi:hypothetical protein
MAERIISFNPGISIRPDQVIKAINRTDPEVDNFKYLKMLGSVLGKPIEITSKKIESDPKKIQQRQQQEAELEAKTTRRANNVLLFKRGN